MEKITQNENEGQLVKAIIFWMNWIFKDDEAYHFTEKNLIRNLKNGKVLYELSLRLEKEEENHHSLFLPQKKKPMVKSYYNKTLNKLFFLNSFEKLVKQNYVGENDLKEISYEDFEKDEKEDTKRLNISKVLPFYWKLMKEYKNRNFKNFSSDYVSIEKNNDYNKFVSDLKTHIFDVSCGITSLLDSKLGIFVVDHFDPNANQSTFMMIGKSKIVEGKEHPTVFTRFGEGLDQKEIDFAVKTTLEAKNNLVDTCVVVFTEAYKETFDFSQNFLPEKKISTQDFKVSKSIDVNNLIMQDVEVNEIIDSNGNLKIQEDQVIVFHNNVEVVFASHQRNPHHTPHILSKWRETYPGFERNYSFCSDLTLLKRVDEFIKGKQTSLRDYPISPHQDTLNSKLEQEVLKQEVLHQNILEEQRQHTLCKMFENNVLKGEVLNDEKKKIISEDQPNKIEKVPSQVDFSHREKFYQQEIDVLKKELQSMEESHVLKEERMRNSLQQLEGQFTREKQKFNTLLTFLIVLFNFGMIGYYFYLLSNPLV